MPSRSGTKWPGLWRLESTLISRGLPQPDNLELAHEVEEIVLGEGVVPATIGKLQSASDPRLRKFVDQFRRSELAPLSGNRCFLGVAKPEYAG